MFHHIDQFQANLLQSKLAMDVLGLVEPLLAPTASNEKQPNRKKSAASRQSSNSGVDFHAASSLKRVTSHKKKKKVESGPTVVRFMPMTFTSNSQTGFEACR